MGSVTIDQSVIASNVATGTLQGNGGGIFSQGLLTVRHSTVGGNSASLDGGGIANLGTAVVNYSTLSGNSATFGGGIINYGTATLNNSTLSGNSAATTGGGIYNTGTTNVYNATIVFNQADADNNGSGTGGGVFNNLGKALNLRNTLVAGNRQGNGTSDCAGTVNSYGRNLFYVNAGCTIVNGTGGSWSLLSELAGIGTLQNNGGPTLTHMPRLGSQMIDGGDAAVGCLGSTGTLLLTDQRGRTRPIDGDGNGSAICDVGAVERQANDSDLAPRLFLPLLRR